MTRRTKLTVAYLGGGFVGWQRQARGRTVQGELEDSLARLAGGRRVPVVGAGRTDAGVHAKAQVAHVDLPAAIPPEVLPRILNGGLATDIRIRSAVSVPDDFHARNSALGKHYVYRAQWREPELPWLALRTAVVHAVDRPRSLETACRGLPGRRDWASFTVPEVARHGSVRTLYRAEVRWLREGLELHFFGEGFLRYQVRRMVGALLDVGRDRMTVAELSELLAFPTPGAPLHTAPARGLTLERVYYRRSPRLELPDRLEPPEER